MTQEEFFKRFTYSVSRDRIGGGGFGTVYKAKDNLLHRTVAIKVSEVKTTADGKKTFSLKDEFEALAHVPKHPNIANYEEFFSFEMPNGIFDYAIMQYYPDGNLSNAIKQGLKAGQKEDIVTQLLEGIGFLHRHKVVHRDLKPGNILIVRDGENIIPLITDFGLSKATGVVDGSVFSNSFGGGTQRYSSPEQLQGKPLRFNTDLWSYGAILYELFTGEQLFTAGSGAANTAQADLEIYNKIVNGNVSGLNKMPEKWRKVAERCLVVDAGKRAKDAAELFAIIKGDDDETEITVGPSTGSGTTSSGTEGSGISIPSSKGAGGQTPPSKGGGGIKKAPPASTDKPKSKKALWIALGAAAAVALLVLFLKPKQEPAPTDPDIEAYQACQTVEDYRAYMRKYGTNAQFYDLAKVIVDQYMADSTAKAQQLATQLQAQAEAEKKEDNAYKKCTTIAACESYLKDYPQGRYVAEVKKKKAELEKAQQQNQQTSSSSSSLTITANGVSFVMKKVTGGTFQMGSNDSEADSDEKRVHSVTVSTFYMGETEVTQALWKAVMGCNPSYWKGDNLPVEQVSWNDCQEFIRKLNGLTGRNFRLPTEAEWEFAARGGNQSNGYKYAGSSNIGNVAWYTDNSGSKTHTVKGKSPNELGLYDMSGNVWEWCSDLYGSYSSGSQTNPRGASSDCARVLRGGNWSSRARYCRVSDRGSYGPEIRFNNGGFRLCLPQ